MSGSTGTWKKGRGKLGVFDPLLGVWRAEAESPQGTVVCTRTFSKALNGAYVRLEAVWQFANQTYEEIAFFGVNAQREVCFWSFTSDGKQSSGVLAAAADVHPQALGFEAQMDAGLARQIYWPGETGNVEWVVESKTKKGWNRFVHHHYTRQEGQASRASVP